ncbi:hypothetical protein ACFVYM_48565, partial [Streptomyces sp. NPDC058298]|uniref:hypothetical protein n=1 Tax=Streptomyces sp. NPDC058298 TaxID=3346434 RepID=UPI0036EF560C
FFVGRRFDRKGGGGGNNANKPWGVVRGAREPDNRGTGAAGAHQAVARNDGGSGEAVHSAADIEVGYVAGDSVIEDGHVHVDGSRAVAGAGGGEPPMPGIDRQIPAS